MAPDPLATPPEVAAYLRKPEKTLANWRSLGIGPDYIKAENGSVRYRWAAVEAWLTGNTIETARTG